MMSNEWLTDSFFFFTKMFFLVVDRFVQYFILQFIQNVASTKIIKFDKGNEYEKNI